MWSRSDERELRDAFKSLRQEPAPATLRERLQDDLEARTKPSAATLRAKALVMAGAVLMAALCAAIILSTFRGQDVLAATLEAMAEVQTAHITGTDLGRRFEAWISREHGSRCESPEWLELFNREGRWIYDVAGNRLFVSDCKPDAAVDQMRSLLLTSALEELHRRGATFTVTDSVMNGRGTKCIKAVYPDAVLSPEAWAVSMHWIDERTMRIVAMKRRGPKPGGGRELKTSLQVEYDVPIDESLFEFQPPAGAQIVDRRSSRP